MTDNQLYINTSDFYDNNSLNSNNINNLQLTKLDSSERNQSGSGFNIMESLRDNPILTTASMPIPPRNNGRIVVDFSDFGFDFESSQSSPQLLQDISLTTANQNSNNVNSLFGMQPIINSNQNLLITNTNTIWDEINSTYVQTKSEPFSIDEDDIFQVNKADLIQGPTFAELNDDTILEDLNLDDLILPDDTGSFLLSTNQSNLHQLQSPTLNSTINPPSVPPQQLLQSQHHHHNHHHQQQHQQQQQQQQQQQEQQHQQEQQQQSQHMSQQQQQQHMSVNSSGLYDEQNTLSSNSFDIFNTTPTKSISSQAAFSPDSQSHSHHSSNSSLLLNCVTPPPPPITVKSINYGTKRQHQQQSALHDLLKKDYQMSPEHGQLGQSVPAGPSSSILISSSALSPGGFNNRRMVNFLHSGGTASSRLSSSAPTHLGLEQIWQRREPRPHLLSTGSLAEAGSTSSLSTGGVLSPEAQDFSHDEDYSDDDSDHYEDFSSDNDSDNDDPRNPNNNNNHTSKKERFFWQYNVQAKGPKGQRLVIKTKVEDPHVLNEVTDPVFSPNCSVRGIKHSGKARKGDGNDLTPNPRKLHSIGKELDKLGRVINDMTPVSELPFNVRPKTRKEKNKLASRACRLKKKAQHEANKIKLHGLETEHKRLINGISQLKQIIATKYYQNQNGDDNLQENFEELNQQIDKITKITTKLKIAGGSTDFVNKILEKVKSGIGNGGLDEL